MIAIVKNIISRLDIHTSEVLKKSFSAMLVRFLGMLFALIISIFLGRTIGPEGLGIINLSTQIVSLFLILSMLGMENVIRKEIAIAFVNKNWQNVASVIYTTLRINLPIGLLISFILFFLTPWVAQTLFNEPNLKIPLWIAILVMVPQMISRIFGSALNGFRKIWQSNLVDKTLSSFVLLLGLLALFMLKIEITIVKVAILYGISRVVVAFAIYSYWNKQFFFKEVCRFQGKPMLKVALPLLLVSGSSLIASNSDIIMLGWLSDTRQVGLYSVAWRLGMITSFFHLVANSVLSPKIASLFSLGKTNELQKMVQEITKGLILLGIFSVVVFFFFGSYILKLWGAEFEVAHSVLIVIALGQFFNISTGATGIILIMTGYEREMGLISLISAITNLILNFFLIPEYGALGAAISSLSVVMIENIIKIFVVKSKTGILSIPKIKL